MEISKKNHNVIFWALISFILIVLIFKWINYLSNNNYIMECFTSGPINETYDGSTSHTVNLPLTTTYSCQNFCGPTSRCSITGQQCFTDIDCPGCQPYSPPLKTIQGSPVPGDNDAGKLTLGVTPQYSSLTSGYGTQETLVTPNPFAEPPMANFGVNVWAAGANQEYNLFNKRYKPPQLNYMSNYPQRYSFTGEFIEDGPFASNATLPPTN